MKLKSVCLSPCLSVGSVCTRPPAEWSEAGGKIFEVTDRRSGTSKILLVHKWMLILMIAFYHWKKKRNLRCILYPSTRDKLIWSLRAIFKFNTVKSVLQPAVHCMVHTVHLPSKQICVLPSTAASRMVQNQESSWIGTVHCSVLTYRNS
jgi:hypothetical protein